VPTAEHGSERRHQPSGLLEKVTKDGAGPRGAEITQGTRPRPDVVEFDRLRMELNQLKRHFQGAVQFGKSGFWK
jgi:hypothetical protein